MDEVTGFDAVFTGVSGRLYSRVASLVGSRALADDLVQDVYVRLRSTERRARRFVEHANPYGYALATAVNMARAHWRSQRRLVPLDAAPHPSHDGGLRRAEAEHEAARLLHELTVKEAAVVVLVDLDGHTLDEAAALLGVHRGTAQRNRMRALAKLRQCVLNGGDARPARRRPRPQARAGAGCDHRQGVARSHRARYP
ncbi:RNA polymerase sigma factor [Actinosynnema sp. NPDC047251]|uniref:RNA polymerase sigma factor n=1 Tax=Saccharothrix espanaensis TaxID=103731 RepID=UPI0003053069|nr:RNA polymerase sigma factor [Saccharothrix espanaensis]